MRNWYHIALFTLVLLVPVLAYGQKTDTVTFYNGDRAVCEIKSLNRGKLLIRTVSMGTISVEWRKVSDVRTKKHFEIVLNDHTTFYGRIDRVDSLKNATLAFGIFQQTVPMNSIVSLTPIRQNFWKELDGSFSIGFAYTKGTQNLQLNSSADVSYRTTRFVNTLNYNANFSRNDANQSEKEDAGYRLQYFHKKRIYNALDMRWERNTELGIKSRIITTLSAGYNPIENNVNVLSFEIGAAGNREFTTSDSVSNNMEGLFRAEYHLFVFANPKIFIDLTSVTYPSFTVKGRLRSNFDSAVSWEIFADFTFKIAFWLNYDNKVVEVGAPSFDLGTNTSISYKF